MVAPFYIPTAVPKCPSFSVSSITLVTVVFFLRATPVSVTWYLLVAWICISLTTNNVEHLSFACVRTHFSLQGMFIRVLSPISVLASGEASFILWCGWVPSYTAGPSVLILSTIPWTPSYVCQLHISNKITLCTKLNTQLTRNFSVFRLLA